MEMLSPLRWLDALPEEQVLAQLLGSLYGIALILAPGHPAGGLDGEDDKTATWGSSGRMNMLRLCWLSNMIQRIHPAPEKFATAVPCTPFPQPGADTLGMGYTLAWDIPAATRAFELVVEISSQSDNVMMVIMALTNLSGLRYVQGQLRTAIATCHQILGLAQRIGSQTRDWQTLLNRRCPEQGDLETALNYLLMLPG
jgi:hypothetical protein